MYKKSLFKESIKWLVKKEHKRSLDKKSIKKLSFGREMSGLGIRNIVKRLNIPCS